MPIPRALAGAKGAGGAVSPGAAVTKCHSLGLKQQKPVLSRSGGQESKIRGQLGWSPRRLGGTLFQVRATLACRLIALVSASVVTGRSPWLLSSYGDTTPNWLRACPAPGDLISATDLGKGSVCK